MRVLVTGGAGQVGRAVAVRCPAQHHCLPLGRDRLDIADPSSVDAVLAQDRFDWIVNCAAYTAVDQAESEPAAAKAVNDAAVAVLAAGARRHGARLLHLSTDFVFDGRRRIAYEPGSPTHPLSVYGRTKLDGEGHVLALETGVVVRTSWVYAAQGRNFVLTMLRLMAEREEVRVVADQFGSPTWAAGLADTLWALIDARPPGGIYHWSDEGVVSWHEFAVAIQQAALARGLLTREIPVRPIATGEYPAKAVRPAFSALDTRATQRIIGRPAVAWRRHLEFMLDEVRAS